MTLELTLDIVRALMDRLDASKLDRLELKTDEFSLTLERNTPPAPIYNMSVGATPLMETAPASPATAATPAPSAEPAPMPAQAAGTVVTAPIVGTFYAAPAPGKPDFAQVGQKVSKGDVLFIIESMKLMNEVLSEYTGTVAEILVENGTVVDYGQPIMRIV